jgi:hypothetical protein
VTLTRLKILAGLGGLWVIVVSLGSMPFLWPDGYSRVQIGMNAQQVHDLVGPSRGGIITDGDTASMYFWTMPDGEFWVSFHYGVDDDKRYIVSDSPLEACKYWILEELGM